MTMNQVKLACNEAIRASGDPTIASSEPNNVSPKLVLAFGKAISAAPGHQSMLSEVAHKEAKAKAHLSGEAISQAFYKGKALSDGAKIASSGEAKASHASDEAISQAFTRLKRYLIAL